MAVLALGGMTHLAVQLAAARTIHLELLLVHVTLVASLALVGAWKAERWQRALHVILASLAFGSAMAPVGTDNPVAQTAGRVVSLAIVLGYSLLWAIRPLRGGLHDRLDAIQFGVGLFVADQLAAFGIGDVMLIASPDLERRSWPLSVFGELIQQGCLLLLVGMCWLAAPRLIDQHGLRLPGPHWRVWKPIVLAALQVECGVILFEILESFVLQWLHIDAASIGNAVFPQPSDWHPDPLMAVLLLAVLPGTVEELVFRGLIFQAVRAYAPIPIAVGVSSGLFAFAHLNASIAPPQLVSVFLYTFVTGSLAAIAYHRTGSLYAAMLAHVFSNVGPALAVVLPRESMIWVFVLTAELSVVGTLPLLFAAVRRLRQRQAVSLRQSS